MTQRISVRPRPSAEDRAPIVKWRDVPAGTEVKATYRGMRQGKFGPLADLEGSKGAVTVPVPTALMTQLSRVRVGAVVAIVYNGKKSNQAGTSMYHDFQVDVFNEGDLLPEDTKPVIAAATNDRPIRGSESGGFTPARQIRQTPAKTTSALAGLNGESEAEPAAEAEEKSEAEAKPAPKPAGRGRALKSVFAGLD